MRVNLTFDVFWQFKDYPHLKITKDKKIIDTHKNRLLVYQKRGFFIGGKYYKRSELKPLIEPIPKREYKPF